MIPGEIKAGSFTSSIKLLQSTGWVMMSSLAIPSAGTAVDLGSRAWDLQIEAAGKVEGQLMEGHLPPTLPRSRPRPRVGVTFTGRTPKCDA